MGDGSNNSADRPLAGIVAVVAGATRGAGRGIAVALGEVGATVYCTGRSVRGRPATPNRPETIEETAERVTAQGGVGIAVQVDHTVEVEVKALFDRVRKEQGRLDILVNDVWGGDALTEWEKPFWELDLQKGFLTMDRAVRAHIITSRYGAPLMIERNRGLIVEITDGDEAVNLHYRAPLFYDLSKTSAMRLAFGMAQELRDTEITALALSPGFLRSEAMLEHFGVTEENWEEAAKVDPHFLQSETPFYVGRAVAALALDPRVKEKAGRAFATWTLAREYGFTDIDGRRPDFGAYLETEMAKRWIAIVGSIHKELAKEDIPKEAVKEDRLRLEVQVEVESADATCRTYSRRYQFPEPLMGSPEKLAKEFAAAFRQAFQR